MKVFAILGSILFILTVWNVSWAAKSWVLKGPAGSYIDALYCDPANSNTVYAGTNGGVYKTMNLGDTWSYSGVRPRWINALGAEPGCGILFAGGWNEVLGTSDGGLSWNSFFTLSDDVTALASSSAPSCIGYAGTENGVYATNGNSGLTDSDTISALAVDSNDYVYAGTEGSGLFKSTNAGLSWTPVLADRMIFALVIDSSDRVFVGSLGDGVLLSTNGGTTWDPKNNGLPTVSGFPGAYVVLSLVKDSAGVLYAGVVTNINPLSGAVYKSLDNGDNWTSTNSSLSYTAESLCVTPTNRLFVGTSRGVFRTDDGGATWINQTGRFGGPYITNSFTVANNGAVLVASDGQGVLKSTDGGETWAPAGTGLPQEMTDVKKDAAGNLYASGFGGVYKSTDHGALWTPSSNGIPGNPAGPLTIPPYGSALGIDGNGNLYAGLDDSSVYRSVNQGAVWDPTAALPFPGDSQEITAILGLTGTTVLVGTDGAGIFKSTDGGLTWFPKNTGLPSDASISQQSLFRNPHNGDIYLSADRSGLYRSTNSGESWVPFPVTASYCNGAVAVDQRNRLYALHCDSAVYRSSDGGATWTAINQGLIPWDPMEGINLKGLYVLNNNTLLLGTRNGGIYKINLLADFDSNADGKTDIAIYRGDWGAWYIKPSDGSDPVGFGWGGDPSDIPVPGDYDGDGKTDVAIYRKNNGAWWIIPSSTGTPYGVGFGGGTTDIPVPGDYDGDGKTDVAIYRQEWGAWYITPSGGGSVIATGWGGGATDIPVPADYDGDGKTDIAIYRAENGAWWIIPSSTGISYGAGLGGGATDIPVPGDYDGDGKTDLAIYRQEWGAWYITPSGGGSTIATGWGGGLTDVPVQGDYDGDGKTDVAIYRAENGAWWIIPSATGTPYGVGFGGAASDIPVITNPALR